MNNAEFKDYIREKRSTLSNSSVNTYSSILRSLYKKVFGEGAVEPKRFDEAKKIIAYLKDVPPNKRKTILSALVIITDKKEFRELMLSDIQDYNNTISKQEKSDQQEKNWVTSEEIDLKLKELQKIAIPLMKKESLSNAELQKVQNYIILALLSGKCGIMPRRSKDYVDMKLRNIDKAKDNYISDDEKHLVFNSYKTAHAYGEQKVKLPVKLRNLLRQWKALNPHEYLLVDSNGNPLGGENKSANGSVKLNQRLEKIFGKKAGVNMMRHSTLTEKYGDMIRKKDDLKQDMKDMGSSMNMSDVYIKKDD